MERVENKYNDFNDFNMMWKSYQILREGLKVSNVEIEELISYHNRNENYEISHQLNSHR